MMKFCPQRWSINPYSLSWLNIATSFHRVQEAGKRLTLKWRNLTNALARWLRPTLIVTNCVDNLCLGYDGTKKVNLFKKDS
jgi:hypothetical protein